MFSTALATVEKYTQPVIFSQRMFDGQVRSGCGTFIVVNREGWILTAAHILSEILLPEKHKPEILDFEAKRKVIAERLGLTPKQIRKEEGRLPRNSQWITNQAILWGWHNLRLTTYSMDPLADLAVGKLDGFDSALVTEYPVFKNPTEPMPFGRSLCRLGFPFHEIKASFNQSTNSFELAPGALPVPRFPNDGIHTRIALINSQDGTRTAKFLETSTPGLRGQSGGPIFDAEGSIWAIQSSTESLPLGFAPIVKQGSREITEHQFMHVGRGAHAEEIVRILRDHKIDFTLSS